MPIRYMALEAITTNRFTVESEIWTFGVVLWEMFTFAQIMPYEKEIPDLTVGQLISYLNAGCRLVPPEIMPPTMCVFVKMVYILMYI